MKTKASIFVLAAAALSGVAACHSEKPAAAIPPPSAAFVTIVPEPVAITGEWIATLDCTVNAQIRPQVSGYLMRRSYR